MSTAIKGGEELSQHLPRPSSFRARKSVNNWKEGMHNLSLHVGNQLAQCKIIREQTALQSIVKENEGLGVQDVYFL